MAEAQGLSACRIFYSFFGFCAASGVVLALRGRSSPFVPDEAFEVVDQVGHADLHPSALDVDGADEQSYARFLRGKDMLDG